MMQLPEGAIVKQADANQADANEGKAESSRESSAASGVARSREEDAIYQGSRVVARVRGAEVDPAAHEIHFAEVYNSSDLLLPENCEFRNYRILIQRLDFATREEHSALYKGRVLRDVVAEILGHREEPET